MSEIVEFNEINTPTLYKSSQIDIIDDIYKIDVNQQIADLSHDLYRYYIAKNINNHEEYYAIVLEKYNSYATNILGLLKSFDGHNISLPIAYNITKISSLNDYRLVIIVNKYDYHNNLLKQINEKGPINFDTATKQIIIPILKLLLFAYKHGFEIGNIAPENFIIRDNVLYHREFFILPPHALQEPHILPSELAGTLPYGRITNNIDADLYALGVVIYYAITGVEQWSKYSENQYNIVRLENSSFNTLTSKLKMSPEVKTILKGLLHDDVFERWKIKDLNDWFHGKPTKNVTNDNFEAISPLSFNNISFMTCRALAYSMFLNWDNALLFIKEEFLIKWIQRSLIKNKSTENIVELFNEQLNYKFSQNQDRDENLFKVLTAFDQYAPLRLNNKFSMTILSIPQMLCVSSCGTVDKKNINHILNIVSKQLWLLSSNNILTTHSKYFAQIIKAFKYYSHSSSCFNIENVLYNLNPNLPCLSSNIGGQYVTNIAELLTALNIQVSYNSQVQIIDKHIIGFIYAKLQLTREQKIHNLKSYPVFANNSTIIALSTLFAAHQHAPNVSINKLTQVLSQRLIELFDEQLHNTKLKNIIRKKLSTAGMIGDITTLINTTSDTGFIEHDIAGYDKAYAEIGTLNNKILALNNKQKVSELGMFFGQRVTVLFSYSLLCVFFLYLLSNYS